MQIACQLLGEKKYIVKEICYIEVRVKNLANRPERGIGDSMGNPVRAEAANAAIDSAIEDTLWTRDIPPGFIARTFPDRRAGRLLVTPAKESDRGRGAPFFDAHTILNGVEVGISLKISSEDRAPRNTIIGGGKAEHMFGLILAARRGQPLPILHFWQDSGGGWSRLAFDAGEYIRAGLTLTGGWEGLLHGPFPCEAAREQLAGLGEILEGLPPIGDGGVCAVSPLLRGQGKYCYLNMKISHAQAGLEWVPVAAPAMPTSYGEVLAWMGHEDMEDMMIG